ncbi:MAG: ABC transporter substrate-binding protein, partial [Planctomycetota bacterium]
DHRANARRSSHNMARAAADAQTLAVFGGMHSPPLLAERPTIHEKELLVLVPWAAAGPITRSGIEPNWIFRLSVDDTKAGSVLAGHAVDVAGSSAPHLVLERTGWGRSNEVTIRASLLEHGIEDPVVHWIDWGIGDKHAEQLARKTIAGEADAVLLVTNSAEATAVIHALRRSGSRAPIVSHWGVMGGPLEGLVPPGTAGSLSVIQTRAVAAMKTPGEVARRAVERAHDSYTDLLIDGRIPSACGFVHAHDLVLLLDAAVAQAGTHGSTLELRRATRTALENLEAPVDGALKRYTRPFRPTTAGDPDGHEALDENDLEMCTVSELGEVTPR